MRCTVQEAQQRIPHTQFLELLAYERIEPHPDETLLLAVARLTAILANCHRDSSKQSTPFDERDFVIRYGKKRRRRGLSNDALLTIFRALGATSGNDCKPSGESQR